MTGRDTTCSIVIFWDGHKTGFYYELKPVERLKALFLHFTRKSTVFVYKTKEGDRKISSRLCV